MNDLVDDEEESSYWRNLLHYGSRIYYNCTDFFRWFFCCPGRTNRVEEILNVSNINVVGSINNGSIESYGSINVEDDIVDEYMPVVEEVEVEEEEEEEGEEKENDGEEE